MEMRATLLSLLEELGFDPADIDDDTRLRDDLGVDSTELTEIAVAVERRLSTRIDAAHVQTLKTFGDLTGFVESVPAHR